MKEIKKKSVNPSTMLYPVPAVMVSCGDMENSNIITVAWTGIMNSDPPYTYVSIRRERFSHDIVDESGEFVINITTEELAKATDYCGVKSGRDVDKFKETGLTKVAADNVKCPLIGESPVNLECKVFERHRFPTHDMYMAEIVAVHVNEELFDSGKIKIEDANVLAYVHGEYYGLKNNPLGFFGYSVAKPKTLKKKNKAAHEKRVEKNKAAHEKRIEKNKAKRGKKYARK